MVIPLILPFRRRREVFFYVFIARSSATHTRMAAGKLLYYNKKLKGDAELGKKKQGTRF